MKFGQLYRSIVYLKQGLYPYAVEKGELIVYISKQEMDLVKFLRVKNGKFVLLFVGEYEVIG